MKEKGRMYTNEQVSERVSAMMVLVFKMFVCVSFFFFFSFCDFSFFVLFARCCSTRISSWRKKVPFSRFTFPVLHYFSFAVLT